MFTKIAKMMEERGWKRQNEATWTSAHVTWTLTKEDGSYNLYELRYWKATEQIPFRTFELFHTFETKNGKHFTLHWHQLTEKNILDDFDYYINTLTIVRGKSDELLR